MTAVIGPTTSTIDAELATRLAGLAPGTGGPSAADLALTQITFLQADAAFWANHLPTFAARMRRLADRYAIAAGILSGVTGLGIWATLAASTDGFWQVVVGCVGILGAILTVVPKQMNYADCASSAFEVAGAYGNVEGELIEARRRLLDKEPGALAFADEVRRKLGDVRGRKMALHPSPDELEAQRLRVLPDPFLSVGGAITLPIGRTPR